MEIDLLIKEKMIEGFKGRFGDVPEQIVFSPGRVNLMGDHIDYNGGKVFPCAITRGTYGAFRKNDKNILRIFSENFWEDGVLCAPYSNPVYDENVGWINYILGIIYEVEKRGYKLDFGFDLYIYGDLPNSAGLSSSASIEMLIVKILEILLGISFSGVNKAYIGMECENEFCKVNSGIMDQFAVANGLLGNGILLDTKTLEYDYYPIDLKGCSLVVACTNKKRTLADSKYNKRRKECDLALEIIRRDYKEIENLCDINVDELDEISNCLQDEKLFMRVKHVVTENSRTSRFINAFARGEIEKAGQIMYESHESLRDDYEVTGKELDAFYDIAKSTKGVLGYRMTGAGFGGCGIMLIEDDFLEEAIISMDSDYFARICLTPTFFKVSISDGV